MLESEQEISVGKREEARRPFVWYMDEIRDGKAILEYAQHERISTRSCHVVGMIVLRKTELKKILHVYDRGTEEIAAVYEVHADTLGCGRFQSLDPFVVKAFFV